MPEIGTSGSMSGDGKRGVAEWPKLPRPSSTLPITTKPTPRHDGRKGPISDIAVECAPSGGHLAGLELTRAAGLSEDESHGQTPLP